MNIGIRFRKAAGNCRIHTPVCLQNICPLGNRLNLFLYSLCWGGRWLRCRRLRGYFCLLDSCYNRSWLHRSWCWGCCWHRCKRCLYRCWQCQPNQRQFQFCSFARISLHPFSAILQNRNCTQDLFHRHRTGQFPQLWKFLRQTTQQFFRNIASFQQHHIPQLFRQLLTKSCHIF